MIFLLECVHFFVLMFVWIFAFYQVLLHFHESVVILLNILVSYLTIFSAA